MAVVSNSGIQGGNTRSSVSWSHNTGSAANPLLLVAVFWGDTYTPVDTITLGGSSIAGNLVALAQADSEQFAHAVAVYAVPGVTGAANLEVVLTSESEMWAASVLVDDADQSNPLRDFAAQGTGDFDVYLEQTVDSEIADAVLGFFAMNGGSAASQDTIVLAAYDSDVKEISTATAASPSTTLTWDRGGGSNWINGAAITVSIQPPTGGDAVVLTAEPGWLELTGAPVSLGTLVHLIVRDANGDLVTNVSGIEAEWYADPDSTEGEPDHVTTIATDANGRADLVLPTTALADEAISGLILRHPSIQTIRGYYAVAVSVP